jgi:hypothetical protein
MSAPAEIHPPLPVDPPSDRVSAVRRRAGPSVSDRVEAEGVLEVERSAEIRRMRLVERLSMRDIARRTGHDRKTVRAGRSLGRSAELRASSQRFEAGPVQGRDRSVAARDPRLPGGGAPALPVAAEDLPKLGQQLTHPSNYNRATTCVRSWRVAHAILDRRDSGPHSRAASAVTKRARQRARTCDLTGWPRGSERPWPRRSASLGAPRFQRLAGHRP